MLRKIRLTLAVLTFVAVTALFLDFTGSIHAWLGWTAKIQFLPALLAVNVGVVIFLVVLTLLVGRVYCSVICPLGVMQDVIAWLGGRGKKRKYRFSYSPQKRWLRYGVLTVFIAAMLLGIGSLVALLDPYGAFGRIASNFLSPLYRWGNNALAYVAERADSYAFYQTEVWVKGMATLVVAALTFIIIGILAWRNGRTYCNTVCPVGTVLGLLSRFALFRIHIDKEKCNSCGLCSRRCKASCIDGKQHRIDYSRCVMCMDCIGTCRHGAIGLHLFSRKKEAAAPASPVQVDTAQVDTARRSFLSGLAAVAAASTLRAQEKKVDGGLAVIQDKQAPRRDTPILPPGSWNARSFASRCTACQLCVSACPNGVLRPSTSLSRFMQPEMSYERGYCRPECTECSQVCPAGAIRPISREDKSSTRIGHAVWVRKNCIPLTDGVECGNCARHCPSGAIQMVPSDAEDTSSPQIPVVNTERCIGCGACENLCPARPFSAIYVEGHSAHSIM